MYESVNNIRKEMQTLNPDSHQAFISQSSVSHQAILKQSLGHPQAVIRQSSGSHQVVIRLLSGSCLYQQQLKLTVISRRQAQQLSGPAPIRPSPRQAQLLSGLLAVTSGPATIRPSRRQAYFPSRQAQPAVRPIALSGPATVRPSCRCQAIYSHNCITLKNAYLLFLWAFLLKLYSNRYFELFDQKRSDFHLLLSMHSK